MLLILEEKLGDLWKKYVSQKTQMICVEDIGFDLDGRNLIQKTFKTLMPIWRS